MGSNLDRVRSVLALFVPTCQLAKHNFQMILKPAKEPENRQLVDKGKCGKKRSYVVCSSKASIKSDWLYSGYRKTTGQTRWVPSPDNFIEFKSSSYFSGSFCSSIRMLFAWWIKKLAEPIRRISVARSSELLLWDWRSWFDVRPFCAPASLSYELPWPLLS